MMTEPNYKEIAEKLYNVIKTIPSLRGFPQYHLVMKEDEDITDLS
jgi:heat shock protein HspQ